MEKNYNGSFVSTREYLNHTNIMETKTIRFEKGEMYCAEEVHHVKRLFTKVKNRDDESDALYYYFPIASFTATITITEDGE